MCLLIIVAVIAFWPAWFGVSWLLTLIGIPGDLAAPLGAVIAIVILATLAKWAWKIADVRVSAMLDDALERKDANDRDGRPPTT
jgi:hypothetical protein